MYAARKFELYPRKIRVRELQNVYFVSTGKCDAALRMHWSAEYAKWIISAGVNPPDRRRRNGEKKSSTASASQTALYVVTYIPGKRIYG